MWSGRVADDVNNNVELATELTVAWLANPNTRVSSEDVPAFLRSIYDTVVALQSGGGSNEELQASEQTYEPAVSVRKSLASKDHIISMIDGKPYKALRRHLSANGLTPDDYRARYNLKPDYPMVAEGYSEARRDMAKKLGLGGRKAGEKVANVQAEAQPAKRGRKSIADAKAAAQAHLGGE